MEIIKLLKLQSNSKQNRDVFRRSQLSRDDATFAHRKYETIVLIHFKILSFPLVSGFSFLITRNTVTAEISTTLKINILMKY